MPPRRQRNVEDVTLRDQIVELRQSNQALQQMMNELLQRIPVTNQSTVHSEGSGRTIFNNEEEDDHSTSSTSNTVAEPAFVNPWSMDRLARALENSDRSIQGELLMHSLSSLEEAYQMALKAEEKLKWGSYRKPESLKNVKDKAEKVAAPTFESPEAQGGGNKDPRKGMSSSNRCFRCGEPGHRSYECPKKKAELNLMNEEEQEPTYDEEVFEKVQCEPDFDAKSLLIQQVLVAPKDGAEKIFDDEECCKTAAMVDWSKPPIYDEYPEDEGIALGELTYVLPVHNTQQSSTWVSNKRKSDDSNWIDEYVYEQRTKLFETFGIIHGFECLFIMDSGSQGNYVSQKLVSFLNLPTEYLPKPYHVS
ncbi:hypothetical protein RHSIM_Rhsim05G0097500 [Rhododendron simsii]|uniref:CCHC-type domain-containing protein n=1 Tax=Rhododendron simsii TaxID=118357 RepID=A0A834GZT9_RHOSS|nr:hypothetical protein RHSIM_Rhsim05G0097500 [Rhododendron simsii]